ncbi:ExeA family protein [Geopsychrobacter electrodiphilus]|uniref:ExeA family protein n=1 Tax=Geopsychrobacter electrodiphilus TaxID=225196 RepID=UPI0003690A9A|nr:ExeA family protein [Geopsychrobacter electrodiphilus]
MYCDFFGLKENPFSIAPDPRYLYMSERHREALAHLLYGLQSDGGFVLLTGEVGTGKTTVCRCLLQQIPANVEVAFVLNPKLTALELLATLCDELRIDYPSGTTSIKLLVDRVNQSLLATHAAHRKTVLILDEAQNLAPEVLEQIRLLTNLETDRHKLLQIIMLGQPELLEMLARPDLRQLAQRITARYHLEPLSLSEVSAYIKHRLAVAGVEHQLFASSIRQIFHLSHGIPRLINMLCDRALLGAYVQEQEAVDPRTLHKAAQELFGSGKPGAKKRDRYGRWLLVTLLLLLGGGGALGLHFYPLRVAQQPRTPATQTLPLPPAATAAPRAMDSLTWPADLPQEQSKRLAYQALFARWGLEYNPTAHELACQFAEQQGLKCLFKRGNLGSLIKLNRPAVLTLHDPRGQSYYATLITLNEETASFRLGTETRRVMRRQIEDAWEGEYALLWRAPASMPKLLHPGDQTPSVIWLDQTLARILNRPPQVENRPRLAGALLKELRQFQSSRGLSPDGVVGAQTLIQLNSLSDKSIPTLNAEGPE